MKKLLITCGVLLTLLTVGLLSAVFSPSADALVTNNGDGTTTFSFTLNNADALRVRDAFVVAYNYRENLTNSTTGEQYPNPQSKSAFTEGKIKGYIREVVQSVEAKQAEEAARQAALAAAQVSVS